MTQHSLVIVITGDVEQIALFHCRVPSFSPDVFRRLLWLSGEEEPLREAGGPGGRELAPDWARGWTSPRAAADTSDPPSCFSMNMNNERLLILERALWGPSTLSRRPPFLTVDATFDPPHTAQTKTSPRHSTWTWISAGISQTLLWNSLLKDKYLMRRSFFFSDEIIHRTHKHL